MPPDLMTYFHSMFQNWTLREFAIVLGLVGQLTIQTGVLVWWGSKLNTTVETVVDQIVEVRAAQATAAEMQMELRIRLAVQEALNATHRDAAAESPRNPQP